MPSVKQKRRARKRAKLRHTHQPNAVAPPTASSPSSMQANDWRAQLWRIIVFWAASRLVLTAAGLFGRWILEPLAPGMTGDIQAAFGITSGFAWLDIWSAQDSFWYYMHTEVGYLGTMASPHDANAPTLAWGHFPLYTWLASPVALLIGNSFIAALIVSNVALIIAAYFLYRLVAGEYNEDIARRAVLFLFLFPTAYVFSCLMSEATFIAFSIGAWLCARRGLWWAAALLALCAGLTRMTGILFTPLLALEYLRQLGWRLPPRTWNLRALFKRGGFQWLWLALAPCGLLIFMAFAWHLTGNPLMMFEAQAVWWPGGRQNPAVNLVRTGYYAMQSEAHGQQLGGELRAALGYGVLMTVLALVALARGWRCIGALLTLYCLGVIALSFSAFYSAALAMPRYLVVLFPLFIIFAHIRNRILFTAVVLMFGGLQFANFALWSAGRQFAM